MILLVPALTNSDYQPLILEDIYEINQQYSSTSTQIIHLDHIPISMSITGAVIGNGTATIWLSNEGVNLLSAGPGNYIEYCLETCSYIFENKNLVLHVQIEGDATLFMESISYNYVLEEMNSAPIWEGDTYFIVDNLSDIRINLSAWRDPEGDPITYSIRRSAISTTIENETLIIHPDRNLDFEDTLQLIALDPYSKAVQEITLRSFIDFPDPNNSIMNIDNSKSRIEFGIAIPDENMPPSMYPVKQLSALDFNEDINLTDFQNCTSFYEHSIQVDSAECPEMNKSASITFYNVDFTAIPLMNGELCPDDVCANVIYDDARDELRFNVAHFTTFTAGAAFNLTIFDTTDSMVVRENESITFFANYSNSTSPANTTNGACQIELNLTGTYAAPQAMIFDGPSQLFTFGSSVGTAGNYTFRVNCLSPEAIVAEDDFEILSAIPNLETINNCQNILTNININESFTNTTGATCFSVNTENITINCTGKTITGSGTNIAFDINAMNNVSFIDCHMDEWGTAIQVLNSDQILVQDTIISNSTVAITLDNSDNAILQNISLINDTSGASFTNGALSPRVNGGTFTDNGFALLSNNAVDLDVAAATFTNNSRAIVIDTTSQADITNNTLTDNNVSVVIEDSSNSNVQDNTFNSDNVSIWVNGTSATGNIDTNTINTAIIGILIEDAGINTFVDNQINNAVKYGIFVDASSQVIQTNTLNANNISIFVNDHASNTITMNTVQNSISEGIVVNNSATNLITSNTIDNNPIGLHVNGGNTNTLQSNTIQNNVWGILLEDASMDNVLSNTIDPNTKGIVLDGADNEIITMNTIRNSVQEGIYINNSANTNTISSQTALTGNNIAIAVFNSSANNINNNNPITTNTIAIKLINTTGTIINTNTITSNNEGIIVDNSTGSSITSNTLTTNTVSAIDLRNVADSNTIQSNTITNPADGIIVTSGSSNQIDSNSFLTNNRGLYLIAGASNNIFLNTFATNTLHAQDDTVLGTNFWNTSQATSGSPPDQGVGNDWDDAANMALVDGNFDTYAESGGDYPYSGTSSAFATGSVQDFGPFVAALECGMTINVSKTLGGDLNSTSVLPGEACITFGVNNITLDCAGFSLLGLTSSETGILANARQDIRIINCSITDWNQGIVLTGSQNVTIRGGSIANSAQEGISMSATTSSTIRDIRINSNVEGIELTAASDFNTFFNVTVDTNTQEGIIITSSDSNSISSSNIMSNTQHGITITTSDATNISTNNISSNTQDGIRLTTATNTDIEFNTIDANNYGIREQTTSDASNIFNNTISNSVQRGLYSTLSSNDRIINNTVSENLYGIYIDRTSTINMTGNNITSAVANSYLFVLDGTTDPHFNHFMNETNLVDGKVLHYYNGVSDLIFNESSNSGFFGCAFCDNITLDNLINLTENGNGLLLYDTTNSNINNISAFSNFFEGIQIFRGSGNNITNSTADNNLQSGVTITSSTDNIFLDNNFFQNSQHGLFLSAANTNNATNTILNNNGIDGLRLQASDTNRFVNLSSLSNTQHGVRLLLGSENNTFLNSTFAGNTQYGLFIDSSSFNNISSTLIENNTFNFGIDGSTTLHFTQYIDNSTTVVNGSSIVYLVGATGTTVDPNTGFFACVLCNSVTGTGLTLSQNSHGALFWESNNSALSNSLVYGNDYYGIYVSGGSGNTFTNNNVSNNVGSIGIGAYMQQTTGNTISGGTINTNNKGISLNSSADSNTITGVTINGNAVVGVELFGADSNTFQSSTVSNSLFGMNLTDSKNNFLITMTVSDNTNTGILLTNSSGNQITGCDVRRNNDGIIVSTNSDSTLVRDCNLGDNTQDGILTQFNVLSNLDDNRMFNNNIGLHVLSANNQTLNENVISTNMFGMTIQNTNFSTISNNTIKEQNISNVYIDPSFNNTIISNVISDSPLGMILEDSSGNTLRSNQFTRSNNTGLLFNGSSENNTVTLNTFTDNNIALSFVDASNLNLIVYNNFFTSTTAHLNDSLNNNYSLPVFILSNATFQGNYWDDVFTKPLNIIDVNLDLYGDIGGQWPYNITNNASIIGTAQDFGPRVSPILFTALNTGSSSISGGNAQCSPNWQCSTWSSCSPYGEQTRFCWDDHGCKDPPEDVLPRSKSCEYVSTCSDGIKNQDETAIDCGGSCGACATCDDGIQNGDEDGIDCGGSCSVSCNALSAPFNDNKNNKKTHQSILNSITGAAVGVANASPMWMWILMLIVIVTAIVSHNEYSKYRDEAFERRVLERAKRHIYSENLNEHVFNKIP